MKNEKDKKCYVNVAASFSENSFENILEHLRLFRVSGLDRFPACASCVRKPEILRVLNIPYGIWRNSEKLSSKSVENSMKIVKNIKILDEILKIAKTFRRKFAKILNLERCEGMIFL